MQDEKTKGLIRYSTVLKKEKRELVLLKSSKCRWHKCSFCDYHLDSSEDLHENFLVNKKQLDKVTGIYKILDVANSGSFFELDLSTVDYIKKVCKDKCISTLICESHWIYKDKIKKLKQDFNNIGVDLKVKIGVETFDYLFRESYLVKGIDESNPEVIARYFDRVCLLFGLPGQTLASMLTDLKTGLKYFDHVYVNIMNRNTTRVMPSPDVINQFKKNIFPLYKDNQNVEILFDNTDFGIGGLSFEQ